MKADTYLVERIALFIGWHQSMLITKYPSHENISAGLKFLRNDSHATHDQLIKIGLFESLYKHAGSASAIVNEYSARALLKNYDSELYEDYFRLIEAYTAQKTLVQSNNQGLITEEAKDLDLRPALYILFNISEEDLQDWKWVGGRYPWEYQEGIDPRKKEVMEYIVPARTFFKSQQSFDAFYNLPQSKYSAALDARSFTEIDEFLVEINSEDGEDVIKTYGKSAIDVVNTIVDFEWVHSIDEIVRVRDGEKWTFQDDISLNELRDLKALVKDKAQIEFVISKDS